MSWTDDLVIKQIGKASTRPSGFTEKSVVLDPNSPRVLELRSMPAARDIFIGLFKEKAYRSSRDNRLPTFTLETVGSFAQSPFPVEWSMAKELHITSI